MAEAALFSLAGKILGTLSSEAFKRCQSIRGAIEDLELLRKTIQTIQAVLLDAEKMQEGSEAVKNWIKRVRDVLYEADDLFDVVTTNDLITQQMNGNKIFKKVQLTFSKLNPLISNASIATAVKRIRETLTQISKDMPPFHFEIRGSEEPARSTRRGAETGSFVDPEEVFGRDADRKAILRFLCDDELNAKGNVSLIAVVGIGGMGKTTLAQLVYNDEDINTCFLQKRWWACISDIFDDREVIGRIFQSLTGRIYQGLSMDTLQKGIRDSVAGGKFLLVLDDLWDESRARWKELLSLFNRGAKGSKIIVTTRSLSVARASNAVKTHPLYGLSEDESWKLFKSIAFSPEQENDPTWISLGREIVKKCANVPLAIKSIASCLRRKPTMLEWESFKVNELSKIKLGGDSIMDALKLSYAHLPSHLKHCFAYCSLFPKDYIIKKEKLVYLWIAQGYVKYECQETIEAAGHAHFMELLRRSFFQEAIEDSNGEIVSCKMHDLVHDLAQSVSGSESIRLTEVSVQIEKNFRHVSVAYNGDRSWQAPLLINFRCLRSYLFMFGSGCCSSIFAQGSGCCSSILDQHLQNFRFLRALDLQSLKFRMVPSSIGELTHLRYLNLSENQFSALPESIRNLVNLLTLNIRDCIFLEAWPKGFRKLLHLRHLDIGGCSSLLHMPPGFGELTSLQHLSDFKVSKGGDGKSSGLDALARMNLHGMLRITYGRWCQDELMQECGQFPDIEKLGIYCYPSMQIPLWWKEDPKLSYLALEQCKHLKHLPPLRCLPRLRILKLKGLEELEYIEEDKVVSTKMFFPFLVKLELLDLQKLKGWSRGVENSEQPFFPFLSHLVIKDCFHLKSMPPSPRLQTLSLKQVRKEMVQQLVSTCSLPSPSTSTPSFTLQSITIDFCSTLESFLGEGQTSLRKLEIRDCMSLKIVQFASKVLEELTLIKCPALELWDYREEEEKKSGLCWGSLPNLRILHLDTTPEAERLPDCLRQRVSLGKLHIRIDSTVLCSSSYYHYEG